MNNNSIILVVDSEPFNRLILEDVLGEHYVVHALPSGRQALEYLSLSSTPSVSLILLNVMMPEVDGFETCRKIKAESRFQDIPVLFISSLAHAADEAFGLSLGAEDFIHKPFSPSVVLGRVRNHLELARSRRYLRERNSALEQLVEERTGDLLREKQQTIVAQDAMISALCALTEVHDNETGNHIRRTQHYVKALAERLSNHSRYAKQLDGNCVQLLFKSAPLHDIGKAVIPDYILLKPGKLSAEEWVMMKRHTEFGRAAIAQAEREIGESASFLRYAREIAYSHHEKWDGSGYPQKLAGEAIPLSARLMAVADAYDALISKRMYKPLFTHRQAIEVIAEGSAKHFDPNIADAFLEIENEFQKIAQRYRDKPPAAH
jgi:putative two-component system response regulator